MSFLTGLIPWWARWLMLAALAAAVFGYGFLKGIDHDTARIAQAQANLATANASIASLRGAISRQNATVAALQAESDRRVAKSTKNLVKADLEAKTWHSEADRLRKLAQAHKTVVVKPGECQAALAAQEIRSGLQ